MTVDHGYGIPEGRSELWSLREDVEVSLATGDGAMRLRGGWGEVTIQRPSSLVSEALQRMQLGPISLDNVIDTRPTPPGSAAADDAEAQLHEVLDRIQPLVIRTLGFGSGEPLLSVVPLTPQARFRPAPLPPDARVSLSTFAQLRTDGREYRLESPLALHRVQLHRPEAFWLIGSLGRPVTVSPDAWAPLGAVTTDALAYLVAAGMMVWAPGGGDGTGGDDELAAAEEAEQAGWTPVDLMFHTRSTTGRHDNVFGITYPLGRAGSPEPVARPRRAGPGITLHRPRWEELSAADPPLVITMEGRRSVRVHGAVPVTADELGDLLYRTARARALITPVDAGAEPSDPGQSPDPRLSDRPYPGGGACYELELYVAIGQCSGISPGVYHYDPVGHRLEPVNLERKAVGELLGSAAERASMAVPPQVVITITARFRRISWKYEGMAYAVVLKDVGVLFQSLYLVCTAMRLAPCAVGSVRLDATAYALGTDWLLEPTVGQFILGRAPDTAPEYDWRWQPVNDAEWPDRARERLREQVT
ncbi:MAG: SagB family peptide dehydrogenase [Actinobacteria bacterium]|nr:SagB family peptide dehydrogenase [Actinomycetota bacterium]